MKPLPPNTVSFREWSKRGVWRPTLPRLRATPYVVIHHSVTNPGGLSDVRQFQQIEEVIYNRKNKVGLRRFSMVAYSWLVGTNGLIGEGRGLRFQNGANRDDKKTGITNSVSMSYCFSGNYHPSVPGVPTLQPTPRQLIAVGDHIAWLIQAGELPKDVRILPHSHVGYTSCCGDRLREQLAQLRWYVANVAEGGSHEMQVCKVNRTDTEGWLVCGPAVLFTTALADSPGGDQGWESVVGPENVFVHRHMKSFFEKATYPGAGETPQIDYERLANLVADELAERLKA